MAYSVGDFIKDGERWVIPYGGVEAGVDHKAVIVCDEGELIGWKYILWGLYMGTRRNANDAKFRAVELLNAPEIFCHTPAKCTAAGRCTKETVCND